MKYFTREELEDITSELIGNPTRETLKKLNEKYNNSVEKGENLIPNINMEPPVVAPIEEVKTEEKTVVQELPRIEKEQAVVNPIPNINTPNIEVPNDVNVNHSSGPIIPSFELPKLETPVSPVSTQNNQPINLTGNLWDVPVPNSNNLMQTTDNFNSVPNTIPTTEVPVGNGPFFGSTQNTVNNSIPIAGVPTNQSPTMFGQFEKNYM